MENVVFIDGGAFTGCSIRAAQKKWNGCKIYSFEPLPENIAILKQIKDITIIEKAIWVEDSVINFYRGQNESGTILVGKTTGNVNDSNSIQIRCINFPAWIKKTLKKTDYNILKLNIEGAEYKVLEALYAKGLLNYFKEFYVQWHYGKGMGIDKQTHRHISNLIKAKEWSVM